MGVRSLGNTLATFGYKFGRTGLEAVSPAPTSEGLTATGGVISDYTDPGGLYRAHVFTASGTFTVSSIGTLGGEIDYLLVGGGGGGGFGRSDDGGAGGGGGGALRYATGYSISAQSYTVTVGGGGATPGSDSTAGFQGGSSILDLDR